MRRIALILIACIITLGAVAQTQSEPSERDINKWRTEMREYKHEFLVKRLSLTREQATQFFEIYDKMDDEIGRLNNEARMLERKIYKAPEGTVTDTEYEAATNAMLELKSKEYEVEKTFYPQFANVLTKAQLFKLKRAERDFTTEIMRHRNRVARDKDAKGNER